MSKRGCPRCGEVCDGCMNPACGVEPCAKCRAEAPELLARVMLESYSVGSGFGLRWDATSAEERAGWRAVADMAVMFGYVRRHEKPAHHVADAAAVLEKLERTLREMGPTASIRAGFEPRGEAFHVSLSDGIGKRGAAGTSLAAALGLVLR